jgi:signal peptidase I
MEEFSWSLLYSVLAGIFISLLIVFYPIKNKSSSLKEWGYFIGIASFFGALALFMTLQTAFLILTIIAGIAFFIYKIKGQYADRSTRTGELVFQLSDLFYMLLALFIIRSFIVEPYQIPSSSMRPGLMAGDFILVNRSAYGLRMPVTNKTIIPTGQVERGDVVVFQYPNNPSMAFIKRAIGLPGDVIEYRNKELRINGQLTEKVFDIETSYVEPDLQVVKVQSYHEKGLAKHPIQIYEIEDQPEIRSLNAVGKFPFRDQCEYDAFDYNGFKCRVPQGHYFVLGDNRDGSSDSRYWGFVSEDALLGRAFLIWLNFSQMKRIGTSIQ